MKCINHPDREQVKDCMLCGNKYCDECIIELKGSNYCKNCLAANLNQQDEPAGHSQKNFVAGPKKSRFWAFLFSIIPGVGYLYLGLMNKGLQTMVLFFGAIFVSGLIGFEEIMALVAPVVMFYSVFDTQQAVKDLNAGLPVEDKQLFDIKRISLTQKWVGYGFIIVGVLALINNMNPYFPFWFVVRRFIPPIVIIAIGAAILYRNTKPPIDPNP